MNNIPIDKIAKCYTFLTIKLKNHTLKNLQLYGKTIVMI